MKRARDKFIGSILLDDVAMIGDQGKMEFPGHHEGDGQGKCSVGAAQHTDETAFAQSLTSDTGHLFAFVLEQQVGGEDGKPLQASD